MNLTHKKINKTIEIKKNFLKVYTGSRESKIQSLRRMMTPFEIYLV